MDKKYRELLLEKLEKVSEIAETMDDVDAAYLAGRLEGVLENERREA